MSLELTDLSFFLEVAEHGSLSRAAGALRLAQPSVSARIAGLERSVGLKLFDRTTRGVILTAAGRALVPYARRCLETAEEGRLAARASAGVARLVMVAPASLAGSIFPRLVSALASEPIEVVCRTAHSREVTEQLSDGVAHLGFLLGTAAPDGIKVRHFYTTPIVWVAPRGHPLLRRSPCRPSDLTEHRMAVHSWGPQATELEAVLREARIPASHICWVSPSSTALTLAMDHGYIAVLPADAVHSDLRTGAVAPLRVVGLPKWSLGVNVAYPQLGAGTAAIAAALRVVEAGSRNDHSVG